MSIQVNGVEITDAQIDAEMRHHQDASRPLDAALRALVIKRVVVDQACRAGLDVSDPEQAAAQLLAQHVVCPVATEEDCHRHYLQHPAHFTVGALAQASHILFQVTPEVDLDRLRLKANAVLDELKAEPDRFAELAKLYSNCPSGALGGNLGQLSQGDTVPEFERALFSGVAGTLVDYVVETRFGLHVIKLDRHIPGKLLPYDHVRQHIATALQAASQDRATKLYLDALVAQAHLEGVNLAGADGVLATD